MTWCKRFNTMSEVNVLLDRSKFGIVFPFTREKKINPQNQAADIQSPIQCTPHGLAIARPVCLPYRSSSFHFLKTTVSYASLHERRMDHHQKLYVPLACDAWTKCGKIHNNFTTLSSTHKVVDVCYNYLFCSCLCNYIWMITKSFKSYWRKHVQTFYVGTRATISITWPQLI